MTEAAITILLVDDDAALLGVMEEALSMTEAYEIAGTVSGAQARKWMAERRFDIVVSDYSLKEPDIDGLTILREARGRSAATLGVLITAYASLEISLEAIRLGAYDFLTKPFQIDELQLTVRNAAEHVKLERENLHLRRQVEQLAESIPRIRHEYEKLMEELKARHEQPGLRITAGAGQLPSRLDSHLQMQSYNRMSETIAEQLDRECRRLEELFEEGLIDEPEFIKGLNERAPSAPARAG